MYGIYIHTYKKSTFTTQINQIWWIYCTWIPWVWECPLKWRPFQGWNITETPDGSCLTAEYGTSLSSSSYIIINIVIILQTMGLNMIEERITVSCHPTELRFQEMFWKPGTTIILLQIGSWPTESLVAFPLISLYSTSQWKIQLLQAMISFTYYLYV